VRQRRLPRGQVARGVVLEQDVPELVEGDVPGVQGGGVGLNQDEVLGVGGDPQPSC